MLYIADPIRSCKILEALEYTSVDIIQIFDFEQKLFPQLKQLFSHTRKKEIEMILTDNQRKYGLLAFLVRCVAGMPYFLRLRGDFWEENRVFTENSSGLIKLRHYL